MKEAGEVTCSCYDSFMGDGFNCIGQTVYEFLVWGDEKWGDHFYISLGTQMGATFQNHLSVRSRHNNHLSMFVPKELKDIHEVSTFGMNNINNYYVACDSIYDVETGKLKKKVR